MILDWDLVSDKFAACYYHHGVKPLHFKWSSSRRWLATRGTDTSVSIWDRTKGSSRFLELTDHFGQVRGLNWSPVQSDLLVSEGLDCCIKFWSMTSSGKCLNSVNTDSQVLSLLWTNRNSELLSCHGSPDNHISLWKYPSMEMNGKSESFKSRSFQYMAISPDGTKVASTLGASIPGTNDEKLMVWDLLHDGPKRYAAKREKNYDFFSGFSSIR